LFVLELLAFVIVGVVILGGIVQRNPLTIIPIPIELLLAYRIVRALDGRY
jgi:hypothetical protein